MARNSEIGTLYPCCGKINAGSGDRSSLLAINKIPQTYSEGGIFMFDDSCYMEPLHLAGRLIMENGGETCRVEETVLRMGHAFGFREVECFAVPSGLFVSYRKSDGTIETAVKRIRRKGIDLTRIDEVNAISRHLEQEKMSCQEVLSQLKAVERRPSRLSPLQMAGAAAMSTAGWSLMFGGGAWDTVTAFFVGLLIEWVTLLMDKFHMQTLVATLAGGFLAAFLPMAVNRLTGALVVEAAVAGALMPMLPGLAMTNAVQDTMRGDMVSGISSAVSAAMSAVLLAVGALAGTAFLRLLTGGAA